MPAGLGSRKPTSGHRRAISMNRAWDDVALLWSCQHFEVNKCQPNSRALWLVTYLLGAF